MTVMERDLPGVTRELETRSLGKSVFLRNERDIWDQLRRQKGLLADAQGLLSARSAEVEDLRLRCADIQAELAMAKEQSAPLVAKIKELEEERDSFRLRAQEATASAKATAGQLGAEQREHQATKVALAEATKAAEASRVEVSAWKGKAEGLEKEASQAAEASVAAQAALDVEKESVLFDLGLKLAELLQVWATMPAVDEILVPCCRGYETRRRGTTRPRPGR
ncbi:uncharacterized protein [Miscanthus floridulus]|uniref:uncharacterized protein n=1 Tax=Miscanthus floridulus TaxID=154761 RepID=UPI0034587587